MLTFAQVDATTAINAGSSILEGRSEGLVFVFIIAVVFCLYGWYVLVPDRKHQREIQERTVAVQQTHAETLAKLSDVCTESHGHIKKNSTTLAAILDLKSIEIDCLEKVATQSNVDIASPLAEMRGVIRAVQHGAVE